MSETRRKPDYPDTPDGRYFVVRGRLWRKSNPALPETSRKALTSELMAARRAVRGAKGDSSGLADARGRVHAAKIALGERGPVWWMDGSPDLNRYLVKNTPYADWYDETFAPTGEAKEHSRGRNVRPEN